MKNEEWNVNYIYCYLFKFDKLFKIKKVKYQIQIEM